MRIHIVAVAGMAFKVTSEVTLAPGESTELRSPYGHTFRLTHMGVSQYQSANRFVSAARSRSWLDSERTRRRSTPKFRSTWSRDSQMKFA